MIKPLQAILSAVVLILGLGAMTATNASPIREADKVCTKCHDESWEKPILAIYQTKHGTVADSRTPGCQTCHGASAGHLADPGTPADMVFTKKTKATGEERSAVCLGCHGKDSNRSHWLTGSHSTRDVACSSCHVIHSNHDDVRDKRTQFEVCFTCHKDKRAEVNRPHHHPILEGKVSCSDCHNPHGSPGGSNLKRDSVNETCYQCHMEKRGPFVRPHEPVTENCTICHNPHGTGVENLLKTRPPFLCHQCHSPHGSNPGALTNQVAAPATLGKTNVNYTQGRGCANCHTEVHGSNNPSIGNPNAQFLLR